ncbi:GTP cyclohydrolase 1 [Emticicia oligotrophica DSM 17448]|uniref:GTP cyclohydrolase 1 n=1 Tax=Emticicia oligotrophica (strain DSM 17448 / CIP 109782 / MTCC 6937 / GPTSA100-15) TaxID=929562 RepID=A0ABN4ARP9_EMTOG|nr:GTP cyclohydrolase I FolE [Emticicia oligotrophica]AFK05250.1 GTP cyclohydrolase 1 [Emticicia oligotrophica DSM 17448]
MSNIQFKENNLVNELLFEDNDHPFTKLETPLREDAFDLNDDEKIEIIEKHFKEIMLTLGLDLQDESLRGTPRRVAKMYVKELFSGLNPENEPAMTLFTNEYNYSEMLVEKNIQFYSCCEHHFVPIVGKVHIAYISGGKVIGLSKLHRIVNHFARRPQVQERMTIQIGNALKRALMTDDVAVYVDADHQCVSSRGVKDQTSSTITTFYDGAFRNEEKRSEFLKVLSI